jgi:hypothetical protein
MPKSPPMLTSDLNPDDQKCDAYHEGGHAVVGIKERLVLKIVTIINAGNAHPHCEWDLTESRRWVGAEGDEARNKLHDFTVRYAIMALASRYSEALCCDVSSVEQEDAFRIDADAIDNVRRSAGLPSFDGIELQQLALTAKARVHEHKDAIIRVADKLRAKRTLTGEEVKNTLDEL